MTNFATIEGRVLARAIKTVLPLVQRWASYPILGCLLLKVEGGVMEMTSCNLDAEITLRIDLNDAAGAWSSVVAPWALVKLAAMAGRDLIRLSPEGTGLRVVQDGVVEFDLPGFEPEAFPRIEGEQGDEVERFEAGRLPELLGKVANFVSTEETRYYLCGIAWQAGMFGRRFVATDGHRLAKTTYRAGPEDTFERIIPECAIPLLRACRESVVSHVWKRAQPHGLQFEGGDRRIRCKVIDGTYPEVDKVIPRDSGGEITIGRDVLMQAATRALALSLQQFGEGRALRFEPAPDGIVISAKHKDYGAGKVMVRARWPEGAAPFGVNGGYLKSVLATCSGEVRLALTKKGGPIAFADVDGTMLRLLMPMKVE